MPFPSLALRPEVEPCPYCGGDCHSDHDNACDGFLGDVDGLIESAPMAAPPDAV